MNALDFGKLSTLYADGGAGVAPYDLNGDGMINSADFTILASHFGQTVTPIEDTGSIALTAGQKYAITVEYYQNYSVASLKLSWSSPSTPFQIIPTLRLYPPGTPSDPVMATAMSASLFSDKPIEKHSAEPVLT